MTKKLNEIEKKELFRTPEGYFNKLPDQLLDKINTSESSTYSIAPVWRWSASIAATILIVLSVNYMLSTNSTEAELSFEDFTDEELVEYLNGNQIQTESLAEALLQEDDWNEIIESSDDVSAYLLEEEILEDISWFEVDTLNI